MKTTATAAIGGCTHTNLDSDRPSWRGLSDAERVEGHSAFFSRASHDLRSPLGVVFQVFQELEADMTPHLTDEHRRLLRLGNRGLRRLRAFVDRIGLISELESGDLDVSLQSTDAVDMVRRAVEVTLAAESRREVAVELALPDGVHRVRLDARLLTFLVIELLGNAIMHARSQVRVSLELDALRMRLSIEDDGDGISPGSRDALFRPFARSTDGRRVALGLAIAAEIARAHHASLDLASSTLPAGRPDTRGARLVLTLDRDGESAAQSD